MIILQIFRFIALFFTGFLVAIGAYVCGWLGFAKARKNVQRLFFVNAVRLWRLNISVEGGLATAPLLIVANHSSYIDVVVVGSLADIRFTPKIEARSWPVLGLLAGAFDVIFVSRARTDSKSIQKTLLDTLNDGQRICIFPEGTTNNGRMLKPFKPSLFALSEQWTGASPLAVQPVAVRYESVDGIPMSEQNWDIVAWYGDDTLLRHLWRLSRVREIKVTMHCLPPLVLQEGESRKSLCAQVEQAIRLFVK